jgi:hypothetical protein
VGEIIGEEILFRVLFKVSHVPIIASTLQPEAGFTFVRPSLPWRLYKDMTAFR